jgi:hypothetical protein
MIEMEKRQGPVRPALITVSGLIHFRGGTMNKMVISVIAGLLLMSFSGCMMEAEDSISWHKVGRSGEPAFENNFRNSDESWQDVAFGKDFYGQVHIVGTAVNTVNPSDSHVIFTLPDSYRPSGAVSFLIFVQTPDGTWSNADLYVTDDGSVIYDGDEEIETVYLGQVIFNPES